jgi:hypothetical protein
MRWGKVGQSGEFSGLWEKGVTLPWGCIDLPLMFRNGERRNELIDGQGIT